MRDDLSPGLQIAQVAHGMAEFCRNHPEPAAAWINGSNYIAVLAVPDEQTLLDHHDVLVGWCGPHLADFNGIPHTLVHEPDIGEHTALVIAPSNYYKRLSNLPCALREPAMA